MLVNRRGGPTRPRHDVRRPCDPRSPSSSRPRPFDKLAAELIGDIFSLACRSVDLPAKKSLRTSASNSHPVMLSMVCKRWNAITLFTPSLWVTITVETRRINEKDWVQWGFSQLRSCLERSGSLPLSISINDDNKDDAVISGILDLIGLHSARWRSIAFGFALGPEFVRKLNSFHGCLPLLEHLKIILSNARSSTNEFICSTFLSAPKLNRLCFTPSWGMAILPKIQIPWNQITEVTFDDGRFKKVEDLYEILGWLSGSLISLTFSAFFEPLDWPRSHPRNITLPKLRTLCFSRECFIVLDVLICPSLQELEIVNASEDSVTKFLECSSCALTHIELCFIDNHDEFTPTYQSILRNTSSSTLKSISLSDATEPILNLLNFNSQQLFPWLETLHLHFRFAMTSDGAEYLLSYLEQLRNVVDSRTLTMASNVTKYGAAGHQSNENQREARSYLKEFVCRFDLEPDGPFIDEDFDEKPIKVFHSFCASRNIITSMKISYVKRFF